ncbi:hypothetical protein TIFTF001_007664 [Ficus carica]|uniref:RRM domain-containing protein n=1 Tax=Ficus carica TaxID=3494 RepID=A0AA88D268_FICCA|nr:hypothetical protein TIFTF001_007664 [Ficus carica]
MGAKAKKSLKKKLSKPASSSQLSVSAQKKKEPSDFLPLEGGPGKKLPVEKPTEDVSKVVYIGRIPHGFYEKEMEGFFRQFGAIKRMRIARNKKVTTWALLIGVRVSTGMARVADGVTWGRLLPDRWSDWSSNGLGEGFKVLPYWRRESMPNTIREKSSPSLHFPHLCYIPFLLTKRGVTGKSKHYGFMEFEDPGVAKIVADTMNNYLLFEHLLQVHVVPLERIHPKLWKGFNFRYKPLDRVQIERKCLDKERTLDEQKKLVDKIMKRELKRQKRIEAAGIDYECPEIVGNIQPASKKIRFE